MTHPFFSIIIPTYHSEQTIVSCLASILAQTFTDYEILVIDGQSSDGTVPMLAAFQKQCPQLRWVSEPDKGIYDAMNKGIKLAQGEWIYFLGSDDFIYDIGVLENIATYLQVYKTKVIYGNVLVDGHAGWAESGTVYDGEFNITKLLHKNICHQSIFYHHSVFKKYGLYKTRYKICADYDYNLHLSSYINFRYLDTIIAVFKGGNSSFNERDTAFEKDKNVNIVQYFHFKLYRKAFRQQQYFLWNAVTECYHQKKYYSTMIALSAYIYQYFMKFLWA